MPGGCRGSVREAVWWAAIRDRLSVQQTVLWWLVLRLILYTLLSYDILYSILVQVSYYIVILGVYLMRHTRCFQSLACLKPLLCYIKSIIEV
jgi:hypothetical protein